MSAFTTQARRDGRCPECGNPIHEGDLLELVGGLGWCHRQCPIDTEEEQVMDLWAGGDVA